MALKGSVFATRARAGSSKLATQYDADGNEIEVLWNLTDDWFCYQNSIHTLFAGQEHTHPYIPLVVPVQSNVTETLIVSAGIQIANSWHTKCTLPSDLSH